jgi:uncharacterized RDD family membrane protein YckC
MSGTVDQRFAPPEAHVEDIAPVDTIQLAGRLIRLGAAVIDGLIAYGLVWLLMRIPSVAALMTPSDASWWKVNIGAPLVGVPLFLLLQAVPLIKRGQTLGKMACKIRIVRTDGSHPTAFRLLVLRYGPGYVAGSVPVLAIIYSLLDPLLIFRASRQCLHDSIADTKVIKL